MKIHLDKLRDEVRSYIMTNCIPSIHGQLSQFFVGLAVPALDTKLTEMLHSSGLVDEAHLIELDELDKMLCSGFDASGGRVSMPIALPKWVSPDPQVIVFEKSDWKAFKHRLMS